MFQATKIIDWNIYFLENLLYNSSGCCRLSKKLHDSLSKLVLRFGIDLRLKIRCWITLSSSIDVLSIKIITSFAGWPETVASKTDTWKFRMYVTTLPIAVLEETITQFNDQY